MPIRRAGELESLEFIDANGTKRFLPDGRKKGGHFDIGDLNRAEAACVAKGFATAATIHEATGYPTEAAPDAVQCLSAIGAVSSV